MYLFQQGHVKLLRSESKNIYNVTKDLFEINAFLLNILFIQKCISFPPKKLDIKDMNNTHYY